MEQHKWDWSGYRGHIIRYRDWNSKIKIVFCLIRSHYMQTNNNLIFTLENLAKSFLSDLERQRDLLRNYNKNLRKTMKI